MEYLEIDGSHGEGGGQILRTAAAFSAILSRPVRVSNIRARRREPGLKRQHLAALRVLKEVFGGKLEGDVEGSTDVSFVPGGRTTARVTVDMKTAASIPLVLQAVIPAVSLSHSSLDLTLFGGTDVPWSPTFDYITLVAADAFGMIGIEFRAECKRRGYYPAGGGHVQTIIKPCREVIALDRRTASVVNGAALFSRCSLLPMHVAERQASSAADVMESNGISVRTRTVSVEDSLSPGSSVTIRNSGGGAVIGADALGARGKPAEAVGREAGSKFAGTARSGAFLDSNLADMVAPLLSFAKDESVLVVPEATLHLETSLWVAKEFTGCEYSFQRGASSTEVRIRPA